MHFELTFGGGLHLLAVVICLCVSTLDMIVHRDNSLMKINGIIMALCLVGIVIGGYFWILSLLAMIAALAVTIVVHIGSASAAAIPPA